MGDEKSKTNDRIGDPYFDRRSGEDRRHVYDVDYFQNGGVERRSGKSRRLQGERREDCTRVSKWSSVCPDETA